MCAIQGIAEENRGLVEQMNAATAHRGPDDHGIFVGGGASLGHSRLAIIDLSALGHQPMATEDTHLQIVFNGEIYNFRELRKELEAAGERFISESDTETILLGYRREGTKFFSKLRGMWALAILDTLHQRLVVSRDPFGIKPLYFYQKGGHFAFSSELRGLAPVLKTYGGTDNAYAHRLYFLFGYIPAPLSPFKEVRKVLPGQVLAFDLATKTLTHDETVLPWDTTLPKKTLADALDDTIRAHFVSDVPVGLLYSGGIDSTLLLARARHLGFDPTAFFLRIPGRLDAEYALAAAKELGVTPVVFEFDETQAHAALARARDSLDEPFADTSYLPTEYLSSQVARTHKVVLSGEGGDEFFGGYHRHKHLLGLHKGVRIVAEALVEHVPPRARRAIESKINRDPYAAYLEFVRVDEGVSSRREALKYLHEQLGTPHDELAVAFDQKFYLPDDLLFKIDRAGMRHGLEGRVPFLDRHFFSTVRGFPLRQRMGKSVSGKGMLKDILREHLPEELVERPKQGFSFPLSLIKSAPKEWLEDAIAHALEHRELLPFDPLHARKSPQLAYLLIIWAGWRKSFTL